MKRKFLSILLCAFLVTSSVIPCNVYAEEETAAEKSESDNAGEEDKEEKEDESSEDQKSNNDESDSDSSEKTQDSSESTQDNDENVQDSGENSQDSSESSPQDSSESTQDNNENVQDSGENSQDSSESSLNDGENYVDNNDNSQDSSEMVQDSDESLQDSSESLQDDISTESAEGEIIRYEVVEDEALIDEVIRTDVDEYGNPIVIVGTEELVLEEDNEIFDFDITDPFEVAANKAVAPSVEDGSWDNYAVSYEFNWDNSQNCWYWGVWDNNGVCYKTPEGTYDDNVRHKIGLYCDGENVHIMIKFAKVSGAYVANSDYNISLDGQSAKFTVAFSDDGQMINANRPQGAYDVTILNGDSSSSSFEAYGTVGKLYVTDDNVSNVLEMSIPLTTLKMQNPNMNIDNFSMVGLHNPNIMYRTASCAGAGNSAIPFAIGSFLIFAGAYYFKRDRFARMEECLAGNINYV